MLRLRTPWAVVATLLLVVFAVSGCTETENDFTTNGPLNVPQMALFAYLDRGWDAFEQDNAAGALSSFKTAQRGWPEEGEAHLGVGWSELLLGEDLDAAVVAFTRASISEEHEADARAGWAFALNVAADYPGSNAQAQIALALAPDWAFAHDADLTAEDLMVIQAENHFMLANYVTSLSFVRQVDPGFWVDVTTPAGRDALLDKIEDLIAAG